MLKRTILLSCVLVSLLICPGLGIASWQLYVDVPFYSQNDPNWSWIPLGWANDVTIGSDGCQLSCVAMLYAKWGYSNMTPSATNSWGRWNNGFRSGTGYIIAENIIDYRKNRSARNINYDQIYSELAAGHPVVVEVNASGRTHFMVIYGFDGSVY